MAAARSMSLELDIRLQATMHRAKMHQAAWVFVEGRFHHRSSFNSKNLTRPNQAGGSDGGRDSDGGHGKRS